MSWEKITTKSTPCPCGEGLIIQDQHSDDWGRYNNGVVSIRCNKCAGKYQVESVYHFSYKPHRGNYEEHFLLPIDYPEYEGITVAGTFTTASDLYNIYERDFVEYLIVNYSYDMLVTAKNMMMRVRAYAKLEGIAQKIVKEHKRQFNTQKVLEVAKKVEEAIEQYKSTSGNYEQREKVRIQEQNQREIYEAEKRKYRIPINI